MTLDDRPERPAGGQPSRARKAVVFLAALLIGFAMFAAPAIFFQMGNAGGYRGANFAILGFVQLVLVTAVVWAGLRALGMKPAAIGWSFEHWRTDTWLGAATAAAWTLIQFGLLFPATGGAGRPDIAAILTMVDGSWLNVLWYLPLGILGGGVAEELYGRGFVITVLEDLLGSTRTATILAAAFAALFFAAGHLPQGWVEWVDILVPSVAYVLLFLKTRRLVAPMVAHAIWNSVAVTGIHVLYG
jgi:membrane protease YdiL (CAAX protease family)